MSEFSEETASLDFLSEDDDELWEQETSGSSGDAASSCDCEITNRYMSQCIKPIIMNDLNRI